MAYGNDPSKWPGAKAKVAERDEDDDYDEKQTHVELDRFDERNFSFFWKFYPTIIEYKLSLLLLLLFYKVQNEINERTNFLDEMTKLGKRKEYEAIIKLEISQVKI